MQLARAAAAKALRDWETPPEAESTQTRAPPEPGLVFARLARAVRDAIALEASIAAGPQPTRASRSTAGTQAETAGASGSEDPRRAVLIRVLQEATKFHPRRAEMHRGIIERVDSDLAQDPDYEFPGETILVAISEDLGIEINYGKMSDETLAELLPKRFHPTPEQAAKNIALYAEGAPF